MSDDLTARCREALQEVARNVSWETSQRQYTSDCLDAYAAAMARAIEAVEDETAPETGWVLEDHEVFVQAALDAARRTDARP